MDRCQKLQPGLKDHPKVLEAVKQLEAYLAIEQNERLYDCKSPWLNIDLTSEQVLKRNKYCDPFGPDNNINIIVTKKS